MFLSIDLLSLFVIYFQYCLIIHVLFFAFSHLRLWYTKLEKILILGNLVFSKTFSETRCHDKNNEPLFKVSVNGLKNLIKHSLSIVSSATFLKKIIIKRSVAYKTQKTILINPLISSISINYNREGRLWTRFLECKDEGWETYVLETGIGPDS